MVLPYQAFVRTRGPEQEATTTSMRQSRSLTPVCNYHHRRSIVCCCLTSTSTSHARSSVYHPLLPQVCSGSPLISPIFSTASRRHGNRNDCTFYGYRTSQWSLHQHHCHFSSHRHCGGPPRWGRDPSSSTFPSPQSLGKFCRLN